MGLEWKIRELRTGLVSNVGRGVSFPGHFSFYCALCSAKERETGGRGEPREGQLNGDCLVSKTWVHENCISISFFFK